MGQALRDGLCRDAVDCAVVDRRDRRRGRACQVTGWVDVEAGYFGWLLAQRRQCVRGTTHSEAGYAGEPSRVLQDDDASAADEVQTARLNTGTAVLCALPWCLLRPG